MPFFDAFPLRALAPRTDLAIVYGRFLVSNSGATLTAVAGDTSAGLTITGAAGIYVLSHKKCRFRMLAIDVQIPVIATVANARQCVQHVPVVNTDDAPSGVLNFNTIENDTATAVAVPVDGSVIEVFGLLGF